MPPRCLTLAPALLLSALHPEARGTLCPSSVQNPLKAPFSLGESLRPSCAHKALWALASSNYLPSSPTGPPPLCSSCTGLLTIPPQAHPTPGHLHILCPLPGKRWSCPWLVPSLPSGCCLSITPSSAACCKIPTLPVPFPCFLSLCNVLCTLLIISFNVHFPPHLNLSSSGKGSDFVFFIHCWIPTAYTKHIGSKNDWLQEREGTRLGEEAQTCARHPSDERWSNTWQVQFNYRRIPGLLSLLSHLSFMPLPPPCPLSYPFSCFLPLLPTFWYLMESH